MAMRREAGHRQSAWGDGHETELCRAAEADRDRFKQRALEAEKEVIALRAALSQKKDAVSYMPLSADQQAHI